MEAKDKPGVFGTLSPAEAGRLGGQKSVAARRAKKDFDWLRDQADKLLPTLVDAAAGNGVFGDLPPHQRLAALKLVLEYAYGKPGQRKPVTEQDVEDEVFEVGVAS